MSSPDLIEPIYIDGRAYSIDDLLEQCSLVGNDPLQPDWRKEVFEFICFFLNSGEEEIVQLTSGTTGDPKEVRLTRDAMLRSARKTLDYLDLRPGDSALLCLPVRYIAGKMMVVRAMAGGLKLILQDPSGRPLEGRSENVTFAAMVPLQVYESLRHKDPLDRIDKLIIGGGELHDSLQWKLAEMQTPAIYSTFGMTETCTHFAMQRINGPEPDPFFRLLEGVEVKLDQRGCLEVLVPGVTPGRVITNDLVEISESGSGFNWLGRFDNVINSGGIKIIPEILEQKAKNCTGNECLMLSQADPKLGELLVMMVEYGGENPPVEQWLDCLRFSLASYEIPKRVLTVNKLPRNSSLKPDRTSAALLLL